MLSAGIGIATEAIMADLAFETKEIVSLARKVSALYPFLSEKERQLLLAIFASAAESATQVQKDHGKFELPKVKGQTPEAKIDEITLELLQEQLLNAYTPGKAPPNGISEKIAGSPPA
jgi:hypothetical protein